MKIEQFGYPLIVVASIATLVLLLSRRTPGTVQVAATGSGYDSFTDLGETNSFIASTPSWGTDPDYIYKAAADRYSQDPATGATGDAPSYLTYNTYGTSNPPRIVAKPDGSVSIANGAGSGGGGCGCGGGCGGCETKCKTDCPTNARITDGRGDCLISLNSPAAEQPIVSDDNLPLYWEQNGAGGAVEYFGVGNSYAYADRNVSA